MRATATSLQICAFAALASLVSVPAGASPLSVGGGQSHKVSVFDLAEARGLSLAVEGSHEGVSVKDASGNCALEKQDDDSWFVKTMDCPLLQELGNASGPLQVLSSTGQELATLQIITAIDMADSKKVASAGWVALPDKVAGHEAAVQVPGAGWVTAGSADAKGVVGLKWKVDGLTQPVDQLLVGKTANLRVRDPEGGEKQWPIKGSDTAASPGAGTAQSSAGSAAPIVDQDQWREYKGCPNRLQDVPRTGPYFICMDVTGESDNSDYYLRLPTRDYILRPNRAFVVVVRHYQDQEVEVAMSGTRGLYFAGDKNAIGDVATRGGDAPARKVRITKRQFAPRQPGSADLSIVADGGKTRVLLEFSIQPVYLGAIRVGLGLVFLPPEREYTIVTVPGSQTREIALATGEQSAPVAAEIVIGFAPFVFQPRGRAYFEKRGLGQRLAPYIGLGVLQTRPDQGAALSLLRSIYLGFEIELTATSSLAASFVLSRSDRLKTPYHVGGPIGEGVQEVPTTLGFRPGAAVVINFSPDFLRFSPIGTSPTPAGPR